MTESRIITAARPLGWHRCGVLAIIAAVLMTSLPSIGWACSVPVFRYALERWPAEPYSALVFHHGELTETALVHMEAIDRYVYQRENQEANLILEPIEVTDAMDPYLASLYEQAGSPEEPWLVVIHPPQARIDEPVLSAPLHDVPIDQLLDSPARFAIANELLNGRTAMWVILHESDAREQAMHEAIELSRWLTEAENTFEIQPIDPADVSPRTAVYDENGDVIVPNLRIDFDIILIDRDDPAERFFVRQLENITYPEDRASPVLVAPVYGRNRVMGILGADYLTRDEVLAACGYLTGPCSCTVRDQNPGYDIISAVTWYDLLEQQMVADHPLPPLTGGPSLDIDGWVDAQLAQSEAAEATANTATATNPTASTTVRATPTVVPSALVNAGPNADAATGSPVEQSVSAAGLIDDPAALTDAAADSVATSSANVDASSSTGSAVIWSLIGASVLVIIAVGIGLWLVLARRP